MIHQSLDPRLREEDKKALARRSFMRRLGGRHSRRSVSYQASQEATPRRGGET